MATRASGYAPDPLGRYYTPAWAVGALVDGYPEIAEAEGFWDPCAGAGHILAALETMGLGTSWSRERRSWGFGGDLRPAPVPVCRAGIVRQDARDAAAPLPEGRIAAITNPPRGRHRANLPRPPHTCIAVDITYSLLAAVGHNGWLALLLPAQFDSAGTRDPLFRSNRLFAARIILTNRLRWENIEQKPSGPSSDHAWFVWDANHRGEPVVRYRGRADGERRLAMGVGAERAAPHPQPLPTRGRGAAA